METIFVVIMFASFKDGRKSSKRVVNAFKSEEKAKSMCSLLSSSYDSYDVVVNYEPIDLF